MSKDDECWEGEKAKWLVLRARSGKVGEVVLRAGSGTVGEKIWCDVCDPLGA